MTDCGTNLSLLGYVRAANESTSFICHANNLDEADKLYQAGASYVTLPHYIGSERVSGFIKRHGYDQDQLHSYRNRHAVTLGKEAIKSS